jgi:hypothetical protein
MFCEPYVEVEDRMIVSKRCHSKSVIRLIALHKLIITFAGAFMIARRDSIGAYEELFL